MKVIYGSEAEIGNILLCIDPDSTVANETWVKVDKYYYAGLFSGTYHNKWDGNCYDFVKIGHDPELAKQLSNQ